MMVISSQRYGVQAVQRALHILALIEKEHERGIQIGPLVEASGLDRTTAYRLVTTLVETGFVHRDANKHYRLGIASMQLGLTTMSRVPLLEAIRPAMQAITRRTGDTTYLAVRNGDYTHTLHMEEGMSPTKAFETVVGALRLTGIGTGGQALLGTLNDTSIQELYSRHHSHFERRNMTLQKLLSIARSGRVDGSINTEGVLIPEVGGVGVAFLTTNDMYAAVSVAALQQKLLPPRRRWISEVIHEELLRYGFKLLKQ